ncbi:hypothetical protein XENTR_v10016867 [Xenopus tropicalis]|nr:hypothetical protein XENTR_v10016867 [Xenopus tropicalis]
MYFNFQQFYINFISDFKLPLIIGQQPSSLFLEAIKDSSLSVLTSANCNSIFCIFCFCEIDEVEALTSIYGDEWCVIDEAERIFCITVSDSSNKPTWTLCLQVILPAEYPASSPPLYQLNAPWLRGEDRLTLANNLEEIYLQNLGENILYQWVEKIREFLLGKSQTSDPGPCLKSTSEETDVDDDCEIPAEELNESFKNSMLFGLNDSSGVEEIPPIIHGETITDRRSTFQAHLAPVVSPYQVKLILNKLYENKKIATATHNIYAYRSVIYRNCIFNSGGVLYQYYAFLHETTISM